MDVKDIAWLAGLLEGEGCFTPRKPGFCPAIQLVMADKDVVIKAAKLLGCHKVIRAKQDSRGGKPLYRTNMYGADAIGWMMTLYTLMGKRRKLKIAECIDCWKNKRTRTYKQRKPYSRGAEIVWSRDVSY